MALCPLAVPGKARLAAAGAEFSVWGLLPQHGAPCRELYAPQHLLQCAWQP